ncbi:hemerythrin domain-containing protein [Nocardioides sp. SR21]|uniref:hemerythrin domain-containing protein n=1 Tax=Nocardioides sp. SR21 TaxID=2919501 RepID=UPI001FA9472B|nr:hemerythrin domain-containing protein [Nocardioides sp. SR21]
MAPTVPTSTNRVVHDGVRRDLARLDAALGGFQDGDAGRARDLERACATLRAELTRYHEHEHDLVGPVLARFEVDPALLATLECEHHATADALREVAEALGHLVQHPTARAAHEARRVADAAREVVDQYLVHQERVVEPRLVDLHGTAEWRAVERRLRARLQTRSRRGLARLGRKHANPRRLP